MGAERLALVTWDSAFCAPIPGSEWVSPPAEEFVPEEFQRWIDSGLLKPEDIKWTGERRLSLEKLTYLDGFEAVQIIHNGTGLWTDDKYLYKSQHHQGPETILQVPGDYAPDQTIFLGEGRRLVRAYLGESTVDTPFQKGMLNVSTTILVRPEITWVYFDRCYASPSLLLQARGDCPPL